MWLSIHTPLNPTRALKFTHRPKYFQVELCTIDAPVQPQQTCSLNVKMVYYFSSNTTSPAAFIYVGKDKVESKSHL